MYILNFVEAEKLGTALRDQSEKNASTNFSSTSGYLGQKTGSNNKYYALGKVCVALLKRFLDGEPVAIVHPTGREVCLDAVGTTLIELRFRDFGAIIRVVLNPYFEIGEQFVQGRLDVNECDLEALLRIFVRKGRELERHSIFGTISFALRRRLFIFKQKHTEELSRVFVKAHYDTPKEVFESFLDPQMVYTCADFECGASTLEQAQLDKFRNTVKRLDVKQGDRVLEIGCGWGSLGAYIATKHNAFVTGLTISEEQKKYAQKRYADLEKLEIIDSDYRNYTPLNVAAYDRVVSVGMLEHVGYCQLGEYFQCVSRSLKLGGTALIHTIARDDVGVTNSWIDKYIFPGGYMAAQHEIIKAAEASGLELSSRTYAYAPLNYIKTLEGWAKNLKLNKSRVSYFSKSELNTRIYLFYFCASIAAFHELDMKATQFVFTKNKFG